MPVIHRPHWKWLVVGYFFFGGIAGSTAAVGAIARLAGGSPGQAIARYATYVSFANLVPCPPLLILDLGRPARFLNMLRVFRPTSPMSVGSWALAAFGATNGLLAMQQVVIDLTRRSRNATRPSHSTRDRVVEPRPGKAETVVALSGPATNALAMTNGALGFFVAGYTGVLLAATAVPLWSKRPALLAPLFLSSAMSSGVAAISATAALAGGLDDDSEARLQNLEGIATIAEGFALAAWVGSLGAAARPIQTGHIGPVLRQLVVAAGIVAPLALTGAARRLPRRLRRPLVALASALTLIGGLALRFAVVEGGRLSADDPQSTFAMTR